MGLHKSIVVRSASFIYSLFSVRVVIDVVYSSLLALTQGQLPNTVNLYGFYRVQQRI